MASCVVALVLLCASQAVALGPVETDSRESTWSLFPTERLYDVYLADPQEVRNAVGRVLGDDQAIADTGDRRVLVQLGGRFGLVRWERPRGAWQLDIEAGFFAWFDSENSFDNLAWDGVYGFYLSRSRGAWAFDLGLRHISAHLGDELVERTGRERIGYTREETTAALSWRPNGITRLYAEGAWGHDLRNEALQEPGRAQLGFELESSKRWWPDTTGAPRLGWYAAVDLSSWEERDWSVDPSVSVGLVAPSGHRTWRAGVTWSDGRVPFGELFEVDESRVGVTVWLDLR